MIQKTDRNSSSNFGRLISAGRGIYRFDHYIGHPAVVSGAERFPVLTDGRDELPPFVFPRYIGTADFDDFLFRCSSKISCPGYIAIGRKFGRRFPPADDELLHAVAPAQTDDEGVSFLSKDFE